MDWKRYGRLALIGVGACVGILILGMIVMGISELVGSGEQQTSKKTGTKVVTETELDVKVVADNPNFYSSAVYLPNSPSDEHCREVAKAVADLEFQGRYGQVQIFDDEWARSMVLPENRGTQLSTEDEARWEQHLRVTYVHNAKGYWFDR